MIITHEKALLSTFPRDVMKSLIMFVAMGVGAALLNTRRLEQ